MKIKALTIRQPWADLISKGMKTMEIRSYKTKYRGRIAIHAGKTFDYYTLFGVGHLYPFNEVYNGNENLMTIGAIIAIGEIHDIIEFNNIPLFRRLEDQHRFCWAFNPENHKYGWMLKDIKELDCPIPWRGMPGLFEVEI